MPDLILNPAEARVLASLVEKSITTPQYYPLTVNAVMLAANQKTVRNPVMNLSEGDTGSALLSLEREKLAARDDRSGRVPKWRHQMHHQMLLKPAEMAVLVTLMLRGPLTGSELRSAAQPLGGPDDLNEVFASLSERAQPLITELPRAPGQKEARIAHLLCGVPPATAIRAPAPAAPGSTEHPRASLEHRIAELERRMNELEKQLGVSAPPQYE
jgi:uncharacterized protein YceH (UPF0502 family)